MFKKQQPTFLENEAELPSTSNAARTANIDYVDEDVQPSLLATSYASNVPSLVAESFDKDISRLDHIVTHFLDFASNEKHTHDDPISLEQ